MADGPLWYKHHPARFNDGVTGLSRAVRGTYITVLNCIYIEGRPVKDDRAFFAAKLECTVKEWLADRAKLIAKGKLHIVTIDGVQCLSNDYADKVLNAYRAQSVKASRAGKASVQARGLKPRNPLKLVDK